jgi:hypothetical protein
MTAVPPIPAIGLAFGVAGVLAVVLMILFGHGERERTDPNDRWRAES